MRSIDLYTAMRAVDDDILERSENAAYRQKKNGWLKWGATAVCFGLLITVALTTLPGILQRSEKIPTPGPGPAVSSLIPLFYYMKEMNLEAREIVAPHLFDESEMPVVTEEQIITTIKNNTAVQGTVTSLNSVCVQDSDTAWYITTMTIAVEEVLSGTADSEVHVVCASNSNEILDADMVPAPGLSGCHEGMHSVFVLREIHNEPWSIAGTEIYPTSLGNYFVLYQLERNDDTLTFVEQNITVSLDDISDKGSVSAEYPETTIVPDFDNKHNSPPSPAKLNFSRHLPIIDKRLYT